MEGLKAIEWDSQFFDLNIGGVVLDKELSETAFNLLKKEDQYDLIYILSKVDQPVISNIYSEVKVEFEKEIKSVNGEINQEIISLRNTAFSKDILQLALDSGEFSRFKMDQNFKTEDFLKLYSAWIHNSIYDTYADEVFGYVLYGKVAGLVTVKIHEKDLAVIGLIGIDESARGKGIGTKLMERAEQYARERQCNKVQVATQKSNEHACKFYLKNGYNIFKETKIYHLWKTK